MSTKQEQKKDPVIELLRELVANSPELEVAKYMLYGNPNGSGIQTTQQAGYLDLEKRVNEMNMMDAGARSFNYEGLELPIKSVGMTVRVRFTISELVGALEILNLARSHIHVNTVNGTEWPSKAVAGTLGSLKINLTFIKSMKSVIKGYLIDKLPGIIDDCYAAYYKSNGNFSYSLAETKLFKIHANIMGAFKSWIEKSVVPEGYDALPADGSMYVQSYDKNMQGFVPSNSRLVLMDEMWLDVAYVKPSESYRYPAHYVKLCKAICARLGKILRTPSTNAEYEGSRIEAAKQFLLTFDLLALPAVADEKSKKKDFQNAVFEHLMLRMNSIIEGSLRQHSQMLEGVQPQLKAYVPDSKNFIRNNVIDFINSLIVWHIDTGLKFQMALVYADTFQAAVVEKPFPQQLGVQGSLKTFRSHFTKNDFVTSLGQFVSGVCNARVMDAIYRFISVHSLTTRDNSRKLLDFSIESQLIANAELTKFTTETEDPALVFSPQAIALIRDPNERARWERAKDKGGFTGIRQNGVMSLTSAIKDKSVGDIPEDPNLLVYANMFDEIANCYADTYDGAFELRKQQKSREAAKAKALARHTGMPVVNAFQQQQYIAQSPAMGVNVPTAMNSASPVMQPAAPQMVPADAPAQFNVAPTAAPAPVSVSPTMPATVGGMPNMPVAPSSPVMSGAASLFPGSGGVGGTSPVAASGSGPANLFGNGGNNATSPVMGAAQPNLFGGSN